MLAQSSHVCKNYFQFNGLLFKTPYENLHLMSSLLNECYYKVLGVQKDATAKEIKTAYYKQAKKYHPDTNSGKCSMKFQKISKAYDVLGNKEKRQQYDALISGGSSYSNKKFSEAYNSSYQYYKRSSYQNFHSMNDQQNEELLKNVFKDYFQMAGYNRVFGSMMSDAFAKSGNNSFKDFIKKTTSSTWKFSDNTNEYEIKMGSNGPILTKKVKK